MKVLGGWKGAAVGLVGLAATDCGPTVNCSADVGSLIRILEQNQANSNKLGIPLRIKYHIDEPKGSEYLQCIIDGVKKDDKWVITQFTKGEDGTSTYEVLIFPENQPPTEQIPNNTR